MATPLVRVLFVIHARNQTRWAWLVQNIAKSEFTHVVVTSMQGDTEKVLDPTFKGVRFWTLESWFADPKGAEFVGWFDVPAERWPDLNNHEDPISRSLWRYVLRWLTRGFFPCEDCVTKVRRVLHEAGVVTPASIVTPADLWNHLRNEGFEYATVESVWSEADPGCGPSDHHPEPQGGDPGDRPQRRRPTRRRARPQL